ncbi:MAG TPA: PP0621 family protein, partial [Pseudomonadales bacterium]|nr:PP0621 family protein [Pseudomonadales bacterium]
NDCCQKAKTVRAGRSFDRDCRSAARPSVAFVVTMLIRLFFVALLLFACYLYLRHRRSRRAAERPLGQFVRCAQCELHLPAEQAIRDGDHWFCGEPHRARYRAINRPKP